MTPCQQLEISCYALLTFCASWTMPSWSCDQVAAMAKALSLAEKTDGVD